MVTELWTESILLTNIQPIRANLATLETIGLDLKSVFAQLRLGCNKVVVCAAPISLDVCKAAPLNSVAFSAYISVGVCACCEREVSRR